MCLFDGETPIVLGYPYCQTFPEMVHFRSKNGPLIWWISMNRQTNDCFDDSWWAILKSKAMGSDETKTSTASWVWVKTTDPKMRVDDGAWVSHMISSFFVFRRYKNDTMGFPRALRSDSHQEQTSFSGLLPRITSLERMVLPLWMAQCSSMLMLVSSAHRMSPNVMSEKSQW